MPLSPGIAVASVELGAGFPRHPVDRILVATALHFRCPLITADRRRIQESGRLTTIW
ncbi:MAG: hypothetical protein ACR2HN_02495 [Tepidiformaceae bacterium]